MNCKVCRKNLDAFYEGILNEDMRSQIEAHIENCIECAESYRLISMTYKIIAEEKELISNLFLSTRIMTRIESLESTPENPRTVSVRKSVLRPALFTLSMAIAVFLGIIIGNIYGTSNAGTSIPVEMTYMDDMSLESVNVFLID